MNKALEQIHKTLAQMGGHCIRVVCDTGNRNFEIWSIASSTMIVHDYGADGCMVYRPLQEQNDIDAECEAIRDWTQDRKYTQALIVALQDQGINPFGSSFREAYLTSK